MAVQVSQRKITMIVLIIAAALILGVVVYQVVYNIRYSANLNLAVAPNDAVILLNDKQIKNENQKIKPGEYTLKIEREGFNPQEMAFNVEKGGTFDVLIALLPTDDNSEWYRNNPKDAIIYDGVITHEQEEAMREAFASDPLVSLLPYTEDSHGLTYIIESSYNEGIALLIRFNTCSEVSVAIYKEQALTWLRSQGFDPNSYQITYRTLCD
jgi:hypothetical protein